MLRTTIGEYMVDRGLPKGARQPGTVLDKKGLEKLLRSLAENHPSEVYRDALKHLADVGRHVSTMTGGHSFGPEHLRTALGAKKIQDEIREKIRRINSDRKSTDDEKEKKILDVLSEASDPLTASVLKESIAEHNPLAMQVVSGARGNPTNLRSLRGGDLTYVDSNNKPIPIPILHSYGHGLTPAEYYAGTFGARKGVIDTKSAVQDAGYLSKQLGQSSHRLVISDLDRESDDPEAAPQGLASNIDDPDNEGALLAIPLGGYAKNTILTPKIISDLAGKGLKRLLVRSPIVGGHPNGGLYARDVGVRERGSLPAKGEFVGIAAAQAASEPLTQGQLSSKHSGGVASNYLQGLRGFPLIDQLVQSPKVFKGGAAHAQRDGRVDKIREAPQGGHYISVDGEEHYVGHGFDPTVKIGDRVEAGDSLSEGIPNPAEVIKHKGIGEGRRYMTEALTRAYRDAGYTIHRRNAEILARGLVDHIELDDEWNEHIPGDVIPYSQFEHKYSPRDGHTIVPPKNAAGLYLEKPVLHYSIGTLVRPSVIKSLEEFGIKNVAVHKDPPIFKPTYVRGMENVAHDRDWMVRFLGSYQKKNFLKGVHRGDVSDESSSSYVPSLARALDFGKYDPIKPLALPEKLPTPPVPSPSIAAQAYEPKVAGLRLNQAWTMLKEAEEDMFKTLKVKYPAGTKRVFREDDDDDDEDDEGCPLRDVTYGCDSGHIDGYTGEDGEPLEIFQGTDPHGDSGMFTIRRHEPWRTKTKFYRDLNSSEKEKMFRGFAAVVHDVTEFAHPKEMLDAMAKFRKDET